MLDGYKSSQNIKHMYEPNLIILGNGFDLFHGLPTSFMDFHKFVSKTNHEVENIFNEYFSMRLGDNNLWSNFEEDLGTFNSNQFFEENNHIDLFDENFRQSFVYSLEDDIESCADTLISNIKTCFFEWIEEISLQTFKKKDFKNIFCPNSKFLSFNYTLVLETIYSIPPERILHIHGSVEECAESLIFGHNLKQEFKYELDENGDSTRTIFSDAEYASRYPFSALKKSVDDIIQQNAIFFNLLKCINSVYIIGHSLNNIDIPYFEYLNRKLNIKKFIVSYYDEKDKSFFIEQLLKIGIAQNKIHLTSISEICNIYRSY